VNLPGIHVYSCDDGGTLMIVALHGVSMWIVVVFHGVSMWIVGAKHLPSSTSTVLDRCKCFAPPSMIPGAAMIRNDGARCVTQGRIGVE
jgi:hypothetical protein